MAGSSNKEGGEENQPTSPIPMKARTTNKKGNPSLAAMGVRTVATDHQITPNPKTALPPTVSAHIPPAIYMKVIAPTVNE